MRLRGLNGMWEVEEGPAEIGVNGVDENSEQDEKGGYSKKQENDEFICTKSYPQLMALWVLRIESISLDYCILTVLIFFQVLYSLCCD